MKLIKKVLVTSFFRVSWFSTQALVLNGLPTCRSAVKSTVIPLPRFEFESKVSHSANHSYRKRNAIATPGVNPIRMLLSIRSIFIPNPILDLVAH